MIDFDELFPKKKVDYKIIIVIVLAFLFAFYVFDLLFGTRSYTRLLDLQNEYKKLEKRVDKLKSTNEKLQKEYFELKQLRGNE
ncbi:MAG TPA: phosphopyruvate hydratase [Nautiliaceae bacterium]|nr:phosphopyruvate hydratase [Nautiliaceae bacterium]